MSDLPATTQPLTEELLQRLLALLGAGLTLSDAARQQRLHPLTLNQWLRRGSTALQKGISAQDPSEGLYVRLREETSSVLASRKLKLLKSMGDIAFDSKTEVTEREGKGGTKVMLIKPATSPAVRFTVQQYLLERADAQQEMDVVAETRVEESIRVQQARQSGDPEQLRAALQADRAEEDLLLHILFRENHAESFTDPLSSDLRESPAPTLYGPLDGGSGE